MSAPAPAGGRGGPTPRGARPRSGFARDRCRPCWPAAAGPWFGRRKRPKTPLPPGRATWPGKKTAAATGWARSPPAAAPPPSGSPPSARGALDYARRRGAFTVAVTANRRSPAARRARVAICPATGPEVIAGSTPPEAGTAPKLVLNMLSTAGAERLLRRSGGSLKTAIVMARLGYDRGAAEERLRRAGGRVGRALKEK